MSIILFTIHLCQKVHTFIGRLLANVDHSDGLRRFILILRLHVLVVHDRAISLVVSIHVLDPLLICQLQINDLFVKFQYCLEVTNSEEMIILEVAHFTDVFTIIDVLQSVLFYESLICQVLL